MRLKTLTNVVMLLLCGTQVFSQALNETVKDVCGNTYKVVQIGHQTWMAENFKCDKYDTKSRLAGQTISREIDNLHPYCVDSKELINGQPHFANMSEAQLNSLGLYYTWDAAVGAVPSDGVLWPTEKEPRKIIYYSNSGKFDGEQGICPNGWHVPTEREFEELIAECGGLSSSAYKLRAKTGWNNLNNCYVYSTDQYGFNLLPDAIDFDGAELWSSTYDYIMNYGNTTFGPKGCIIISENPRPIRCVMNKNGNQTTNEKIRIDEISHSGVVNEYVDGYIDAEGGKISLDIFSNASWTVHSDADWVSASTYTGNNNQAVTLTIAPNTKNTADKTTVAFKTTNGTTALLYITRKASCPSKILYDKDLTDCMGNTYKTVKIGKQIWTANLFQCIKYDTESERVRDAKAKGEPTDIYLPLEQTNSLSPYYYGSPELAYVYNWAGALGIATESDAKNFTQPKSGHIQGICPNGWHIPTWQECDELRNALGGIDSKTIEPLLSCNGFDTNYGGASVTWTATPSNSTYAILYILDYAHGVNHDKTTQVPIRCVKNEIEDTISITPKELVFEATGGAKTIIIRTNATWEAKASQQWVILGSQKGKDGPKTIQVAPNNSTATDHAVVTYKTQSGKTATVTITRKGKEKCRADEYPQVKIGNQIWMAENYRCSKYDTESEAYKNGMLTVPAFDQSSYTIHDYSPYYTDATDKGKWAHGFYSCSDNLTDAHITKLGYAYNWTAAVGIADGEKQTENFSGNRQGICPNGWHVPSVDEWETLRNFIETIDGKGSGTAGEHLQSTSGWYDVGLPTQYPQGLDSYGFAALPVGYSSGDEFFGVGEFAYFWLATITESDVSFNIELHISDSGYSRYSKCGTSISFGHSVRCLKNEEVPADDSDVVSGPVIANVNSGASVPCKDIIINAKVTSTCKLKEVTLHYKDSKSEGGYQSVPMNGTDDDLYTGKIDAGVTVNGTVNYYIDAADTNGRHGIYGDISSPEHIDVNQTATLSTSGAMAIEIGGGMTTDCRPMDDGTRYRAYFKSVCNGSEFEWLAGESVWNSFHGKEILTVYGNTNGDTSLKNGFNEGEDIIIKAVNGDNQEYVLNGHGLTYSTVAKTKTLDRGNACSGQSQLEVSQYMVDFGECDNPKTVTLRLTAYGCEEISIKSVSLEKKDKFSYFSISEFKERTISCGETIEIPVTYVPTEDDENCLVIEYYERETPVSVTVALTGKSKRKSMCSGISINKGLLNTDGTLSGTLQVGNSTHIEMSLKSKCNKNAEELLNGVYDGTQGFSAAGKLSEGDYKITIYTNDKVCEYFFNVKK